MGSPDISSVWREEGVVHPAAEASLEAAGDIRLRRVAIRRRNRTRGDRLCATDGVCRRCGVFARVRAQSWGSSTQQPIDDEDDHRVSGGYSRLHTKRRRAEAFCKSHHAAAAVAWRTHIWRSRKRFFRVALPSLHSSETHVWRPLSGCRSRGRKRFRWCHWGVEGAGHRWRGSLVGRLYCPPFRSRLCRGC